MKKFGVFITVMFLIASLATAQMYDKDDSYFRYDGKGYNIESGHIFYRASHDNCFEMTISFCTSGATLNRDGWGSVISYTPFKGSGMVISCNVFSSSHKFLGNGTYKPVKKDKMAPGKFYAPIFITIPASKEKPDITYGKGKIKVDRNNDNYIIHFWFYDEKGTGINGVYNGKLTFDEVAYPAKD